MLFRVARPLAVLALVAATAVPVAFAVATAASASPPTSPAVSETAARNFGNGGPADLALVNAATITTAADGSVLFYDAVAHEIRRVDSSTHVVDAIAGIGAAPSGVPVVNTTDPATAVPLPPITGLWTDAAADVFAWFGPSLGLYRLAASDGRWQLAVAAGNPADQHDFTGFAVTPGGDVIAVNSAHAVIRRFDLGSDPHGLGTLIAGTDGAPGSAGDGGPATSATITPSGPVAVSAGADIFFSGGGWDRVIRRITADGTISTVSDPTSTLSVVDLAASGDGATLYVLAHPVGGAEQLLALPATGGATRVVAGPLPACASNTTVCLGTSLTETVISGIEDVLVAGQGSILRWPADGSDPLAYDRFAGVLNDANGVESPDGAPLDDAFLSPMYDVAVSPAGTIAVATAGGIRTVSGIDPSATVGTAAADIHANTLRYAQDGTLYALVPAPTPHVVAVSPAKTVTTVLGGGTQPVVAGASGTDIQLSWNANMTVDPSNGFVYFDSGDATIWDLDPGTGVIGRLGDVAAFTNQPGELAATSGHAVVVAVGSASLVRVDPDGTTHVLDCTASCPIQRLHVLSDGIIVGSQMIRGPDGGVQTLNGAAASLFAVTADNRLLGAGNDGLTGGLLAYTDPISAPTAVDAPTVTVSPASGAVDVDVTPAAVEGQHIQIFAGAEGPDGQWLSPPSAVDDTVSDGTGAAYHRSFAHLFSAGPGTPPATTYRIEVVASEYDLATRTGVADAPQAFHVQPLADTTPPPPPGIVLANGGTSVNLIVTLPADPGLDRVVVCETTDGTVPSGPWGCTDVGEVQYVDASPSVVMARVDPLVTSTFTAFAVDASGNASTPVSVSRPAAEVVNEPAVTGVGYDSAPGGELVMWQADWALDVRYAAGATPPATVHDGTRAGQYESAFHYAATVPVATGAKVGVSIFSYLDSGLTKLGRTSFVLTGGASTDVVSLTTTSTVNPGTRPSVRATVVRHSPTDGPLPVSAGKVTLYRRPAGASTWSTVTSALTTAAGNAGFTVPVPSGATDYQARYLALGTVTTASRSVRTSVRQVVTASLPGRIAHGRTFTVTGVVTPHRAATVLLQRYAGGRWTTLVSSTATSAGAYRLRYVPRTAGRWHVRVLVFPTRTLLSGVTSTRTLIVT